MTEEEDPPSFKAARKKDKERLQGLEHNGVLETGKIFNSIIDICRSRISSFSLTNFVRRDTLIVGFSYS